MPSSWYQAPSGSDCLWCHDENTGYEPFDDDDAEVELCRGHLAEFLGTSIDGLDRMDGMHL